MQDLLSTHLLEKKSCPLPGIGVLTIEHESAWYDVANKLMHPPVDKIVFNENGIANSNDVVSYISSVRNTDKASADSMLTAFCNSWQQKLNSYEPLEFGKLGYLQKDEDGRIIFINNTALSFYEAVPAERVIHKDKEHTVLVGDKETTSSVMTEFYKETPARKKKLWTIAATVLAVLSITVIAYHFSIYPFSPNGVGNASSFPVNEPPATHINP
jgi:hypothetical protein